MAIKERKKGQNCSNCRFWDFRTRMCVSNGIVKRPWSDNWCQCYEWQPPKRLYDSKKWNEPYK